MKKTLRAAVSEGEARTPAMTTPPRKVTVYVVGGPHDRKRFHGRRFANGELLVNDMPSDGAYRFVAWSGLCGSVALLVHWDVNADALIHFLLEKYCNRTDDE